MNRAASGDKYFFDICGSLYQLGHIEEQFVANLIEARPHRSDEIRQLREFWFAPEPLDTADKELAIEIRSPRVLTIESPETEIQTQPVSKQVLLIEDDNKETTKVEPVRRRLVDWQAGARAYLEVFGIGENADNRRYNVRRLSPWTACVRPPVQPRDDFMPFDAIKLGLDELAGRLRELEKVRGADQLPDTGEKAREIASSAVPIIEDVGAQLYQKIYRAGSYFEFDNVFVEFGIDESVSYYPWELMFDFKVFYV